MYLEAPLPFIQEYIKDLNKSLIKSGSQNYLSKTQRYWLGFCLLAILVTNSVCWARFERASLKRYSQGALSWMFRHSKICWDQLLIHSVALILSKYGIKEGVMALDDSDHSRSKTAKKLHKTHKLKDKKTGGYMNGQSLIALVLVSESITFPVGFAFYAPDPVIQAWKKEDERLKKKGVKKRDRPCKPSPGKEYPPKEDLALILLQEFRNNFSRVRVVSILADALYGTGNFLDKASAIFGNNQVVSQLRKNQIIEFQNKSDNLESFFKDRPFCKQKICLRGVSTEVKFCFVRAKVKAHDWKKRVIIALKYSGEEEYRYLIASDLSWGASSIIKIYALRWLVDVFFQDWKSYEGWGQLAKHTGYEGSSRGLILSLLLDHSLFFHPEQKVRIQDKLPVATVGKLREKIIMETFIEFVKNLLKDENPKHKLEQLAEQADLIFKLAPSKKHLNTLDIKFDQFANAA